ncbi:MAG: lactonase family protein [Candidatus Onthomonas sp.]
MNPFHFYIGSYASAREEGIAEYRFDPDSGTITKILSYTGVCHPSYLAVHPSKPLLYAVEERAPFGKLHTFRRTGSSLELVCSVTTSGANPCHLSLSKDGSMLFAANYSSGSLAVYQLDEAGLPIRQSQLIQYTGHGVNPVRQECAHIHFASEHSKTIYVSDLGTDRVFCYLSESKSGSLHSLLPPICTPPGSGPRHLAFHPLLEGLLYILCELSNTICVIQEQAGGYETLQRISTLPEDFTGPSKAAAIRISQDGRYLFASNRGHDSISVYAIQADGTLVLLQICPSGGASPRDFLLYGPCLVAANQDSNSITFFRQDEGAGSLSPLSVAAVHTKPCCVCPAAPSVPSR